MQRVNELQKVQTAATCTHTVQHYVMIANLFCNTHLMGSFMYTVHLGF